MTDELDATHMEAFLSNAGEVDRLMEIHVSVAGDSVGRKVGVEVLNKSAIVLLVACWEAFVEDLANASFDVLLSRAASPESIPAKVRAHVARELKSDDNDLALWSVAGEGWRSTLSSYRERVIDRYTGKLNTPRHSQIDAMCEAMVGLKNISKYWKWPKVTAAQARARLGELVTLRGAIAHRVSDSNPVRKSRVTRESRFVTRLAVSTHNAMNSYLAEAVRSDVWWDYEYKAS